MAHRQDGRVARHGNTASVLTVKQFHFFFNRENFPVTGSISFLPFRLPTRDRFRCVRGRSVLILFSRMIWLMKGVLSL